MKRDPLELEKIARDLWTHEEQIFADTRIELADLQKVQDRLNSATIEETVTNGHKLLLTAWNAYQWYHDNMDRANASAEKVEREKKAQSPLLG